MLFVQILDEISTISTQLLQRACEREDQSRSQILRVRHESSQQPNDPTMLPYPPSVTTARSFFSTVYVYIINIIVIVY